MKKYNLTTLGIAGMMGSGKSTALEFFKKKGFATYDLDIEAKKLLKKDTVIYKKIIKVFGERILNKNKAINKKKLRGIVFNNKEGDFYKDNDERCIFFCKGVLETVIKLGWAPDIVHCNDWMTCLIPLYIKSTYKNDPIFKDTKTVFTVYDNAFKHKFDKSIIEKAKMTDIDDGMLNSLKTGDYKGFLKIGMEYADAVIKSKDEISKRFDKLISDTVKEKKFDVIKSDENYLEAYYKLYNELVS